MIKKKPAAASKTELASLQKLVVNCLTSDLEQSLQSGEINQAAIRNALQLLRDNDIVAADDLEADFDRLASMLPKVDPDLVLSTTRRYS